MTTLKAGNILSQVSQSRLNYRMSYVFDFLSPWLFAYVGLRHTFSWPLNTISLVTGFIAFTLFEYLLHRWILHGRANFLRSLHQAHHREPDQAAAFLSPTSVSVPWLFWFALTYFVPVSVASFLVCGFVAGYWVYGIVHHLEHSLRINQIPFRWFQKKWAWHSVHHHLEHTNFGVTTSLWDHVFGTHYRQQGKAAKRWGRLNK